MFVKFTKAALSSLNDEDLCWTCIEPAILTYKQSKGKDFTQDYYRKFSKAQQSLFMYTVFFKHALGSKEEYYWWTANLLMYRNSWPELKKALLFFDDQAMIDHLEHHISTLHTKEIDFANPSLSLLKNDLDFQSTIVTSFSKFQSLSQHTTANISTYIRNHVNEFIKIEV